MRWRRQLIAAAVVLAASAVQPVGTDVAAAVTPTYAVAGQLVEVDRAADSDTVWMIKRGQVWNDSYDGWENVNYRVVQYAPAKSLRVHQLPGVGWPASIDDLTVVADDNVWVTAGRKVFHWDGTSWSLEYTSPAETSADVYARAADDVWVLVTFPAYGTPSYELRHWNGAQWANVEPPASTGVHWIHDLIPLAQDDVWALGDFEDPDHNYDTTGLAWHWDGRSWTEEQIAGGDFVLDHGSASATGSAIWAAGAVVGPISECGGVSPCRLGSAVARMTDGQWQRKQLPGDGVSVETAGPRIDSTAGGDAWLVGARPGHRYLPLIGRTNNGAWQYVERSSYPVCEGGRLQLSDVDAATNDDVYVVGSCVMHTNNDTEADDRYYTLIGHYNGYWGRG